MSAKLAIRNIADYRPQGYGRVERLRDLAAEVSTEHAIVELGVNRGLTTISMAQATQAHVYSIDLWDMRLPQPKLDGHRVRRGFSGTEEFRAFLDSLEAAGLNSQVTWVKGDTAQAAKLWSRPIGLLHIDAAHDYDSVRKDFKGWAPFVVPGGFLCMDDADGRGVRRVIDELVNAEDWDAEPDLVEGRLFVAVRK